MQDAIVKEITVNASKERVYQTITDPAEIVKWFPEAVEGGTLDVGQEPTFIFMEGQRRRRIVVVAADPFGYFAFRWAPGPDGLSEKRVMELPNTLIEFHIDDLGEKTKVTVKESGFAALPAEFATTTHDQNSGGWDYMFDRLSTLLG